MAYRVVQEGTTVWPSVMIRLGPHRHYNKITRANIVNAGADKNTVA